MFDVWIGKTNLTLIMVYFSVFAMLPFQIFLCLRIKSKFIKIMPTIFLGFLIIYFIIKSYTSLDWNAVGYFMFAIYTLALLVMCGLGWLVAYIIRKYRKK